ncbi:MAG: hypothetical protein HON98_07000 [Chloroflexi bacterium]|jgi:membrane-bound serine protease (ClpP class)|nr:hypothetical protein [Chloroflexota bacterium]MBT3669691.1 hypothetical protein [Chloroflexota bacterium]MBT4305655.1 hypothetical protein [Chloroflexota bacterium]MBT4533812.1 hypothetical protein [Chloroflexota bacterium]MBT4683496.1 hypothetical protein [Chloroflexota bacterium]
MSTFLLNPNFAYVTLVVGFLLIIFAILQPGTGVLEGSAIIVLLLSGWQINNLSINIWALTILIFSIIAFLFAIKQKRKPYFLVASILAFIIGSIFMFREGTSAFSAAVNPILATFISIVGGGFLWIMTVKLLAARDRQPTHDLERLIGKLGEARTKIHQSGTIYASGESWTAQSDKPIKLGSKVKVLAREGFVLKVEEIIEKT